MIYKVYLSGHLRNAWREQVVRACKDLPIEFLIPVRAVGTLHPGYYASKDMLFINKADIVFAYIQDSEDNKNPKYFGLGVEVGYARGQNKVIILVNELQEKDITFRFVEPLAHTVATDLTEGIDVLKFCVTGESSFKWRSCEV